MKFLYVRHRSLLFRSYLIIVGGLAVTAAVLDFGLERLQDPAPRVPGHWIGGTLNLIEDQLERVPDSERSAAVRTLEGQLGFPIKLIPVDEVVQPGGSDTATQEVFDENGHSAYIRTSVSLRSVIQIGPTEEDPPQESRMILLIPPLFYLSIFVFVGLWLWPLVRDLNVLTESAASFAADYRRPIRTLKKVTSLRELAGSFDQMSLRISNLIQHQSELTDALSHEMRTPLARIKFALAVIGDQARSCGELKSISQDVEEIDRLINTMLSYARLDHSDLEIDLQLTPIDAWLEQVLRKFRAQNQELRIEQLRTIEQVKIDPHLMELALSNMLVNACRYAKSRVLVQFAREADGFRLSVEDDGSGIPEAERQNVFKAYSRLDSSRNRHTGGYGLGLAIVARVADLHGASASAEQSRLGGARIVIAWGGSVRQ